MTSNICKTCGHLQSRHIPNNGGCGARRSTPGGRTYRCDCDNFVSSLIELDPVGRRGRQPMFAAKIGTMGSSYQSRMNCSILESAEEYAHEWEMKAITGQSVRAFIYHMAWNITLSLYRLPRDTPRKGRECFCDGGLPMIKPDCPIHGHLVRNAESEERNGAS